MNSQEIRARFFEFFKKYGHVTVPSSSLVPDDSSVLLTTAGMQQFKRYYTNELNAVHDFGSKNVVSIQKCFRTSDIDEVGDESHLTFFEMMGNFSFGGYHKREAIRYAYDFLTKEMNLEIDYVTIFDPQKVTEGDWRKNGVPCDEESYVIWKNEIGIEEKNIRCEGIDNFWGPTGSEGPCGPTTEIYVKTIDGKSIEVWNLVFNELYCDKNKKLTKLENPGIDTGMGFERLAMMSQKVRTIFETDTFSSLFSLLPHHLPEKTKRILVDHTRAVVFLLTDGVRPSNKEAGYILRRLMRRMMVYVYRSEEKINIDTLLTKTAEIYVHFYSNIDVKEIYKEYIQEYERFQKTLQNGLKELDHIPLLHAQSAFMLYESFGIPYEIIKEIGGEKASVLTREDFNKEFLRHQEISRAGQEKKFGGHGLFLDTGELKAGNEDELKKVTRLHTVTHLLQQALRDVLGNEIGQRGSDITGERTRFDFTFSRKLTLEEIKKVEDIVNQKIKDDLPIQFQEMQKSDAEKTGALFFFKQRYPDVVKVYYMGEDLKTAYSKEFCGGPHVMHTGEIGHFKIIKEEAVGAGVRRIRGIIE